MLGHRTYPSKSVGRITVLALTAVIAVALSLVLTCSAVDLPVTQPKLENAVVNPQESVTWDQTFTYAVNCIFYDTASITLEVYSLSLHDWTAIGDRTYTGTGEWQSLTWENVQLCSGKCEGTSSYRFKYNGSILLTESGPTIAPPATLPPTVEIFNNAMVKPAYGHYNDSFTYSVFARLNQTRNITLEVFDISSYEWKTVGDAFYTDKGNWQLLSWADVTDVSAVDSAGLSSYRFFFFDAGARRESEVFYGPELGLYPTPVPAPVVIHRGGGGLSRGGLLEDEFLQKELAEKLEPLIVPGCDEIEAPVLISATVTRDRGSWDYSVDVEHPNRADMWLTLVVYCPGKGENYIVSSKAIWDYNETNRETVEWRGVNIFSEEYVNADEPPRYDIHYNDGCNNGSWESSDMELPFFTSVLTEPSVSPEEWTYKEHVEIEPPKLINATVTPKRGSWRESYDYCAVVVNPNRTAMNITLEVYCPSKNKICTHETRKINPSMYNKTNMAKVEWRDVNAFSKDDVEAEESPKYYILYNDSINGYSKFSGPELNSAPVLSNYTVIPEMGTYKDVFVYKVDVMDDDGDDVVVTLHIVDSKGNWTNETHVIPGIETKRGKTERWVDNEFTKEASSKTFKYYFSATDGIDDEKVEGEGPSIKRDIQLSVGYLVLNPLIFLVVSMIALLLPLWLYGKFKSTEKELLKNRDKVKETAESLEKKKETTIEGRIVDEEIF
jgi:hypothetical protein